MTFYRYVAVEYAVTNRNGDFTSPKFPNPVIQIMEFDLIRETEKGFWISVAGKSKWVSKTARKRYAYQTKEDALRNFIARTERRVEILKRQTESDESALWLAKEMQSKGEL